MTVTLLGPQRKPTVDQVLDSVAADTRLATVTAGWREREPDDAELDSLLGGRTVNLNLYGRWLDVVAQDPEYGAAELEHQILLDEFRDLYLVQLASAIGAIRLLAGRNGDRSSTIAAAVADGEAVLALIDEQHMAHIREANAAFNDALRPEEREVIARHRGEVHQVLSEVGSLVVAGGHVGELLRTLHLFHVAPYIPGHVIAWSAGAMALTEQVVLYHDRVPQGPAPDEIYDDGLGVIHNLVLLPHARRRLRIDDPLRMAALAHRFAPAVCVVLDDGVRVDLTADGGLPAGARVIDTSGHIVSLGDT